MATSGATGILGTGSYVPGHAVGNEQLCGLVPDADPDWIVSKTQIRSRRFAAADQATSDLAGRAAREALADAGVAASRIDYLIVATSTGDSPQPPTSCLVQQQIGAMRAACFDINVVCAGFVFALDVARSLVGRRPGALALVVAADVYSRILDFGDRRTAVLFGDGAGAAVVGAVPGDRGIIDVQLASRGDAAGLIGVEAGGSRRPASAETLAEGGHWFRMRGRDVRDFVLDEVPPVVEELLCRAKVKPQDVDHFVPHQANGPMVLELAGRCGLDDARTHLVLDRFGNTGSASVALALDAAARGGAFAPGDTVLLTAFGGGMSVGACLLRW